MVRKCSAQLAKEILVQYLGSNTVQGLCLHRQRLRRFSLTHTLLLRTADRQRGWCCFRKHSAVSEQGTDRLPVWFPQVCGHFLGSSESERGTGPVTLVWAYASFSKPQQGDQERAKLEGQW